MADAEPDQALLRATIPVQTESQGLTAGREREADPLVVDDLERQPGLTPGPQREAQHQAACPGLQRDRVQRPLRGQTQLVGNHALGELDEAVIGPAVGHPGATGT